MRMSGVRATVTAGLLAAAMLGVALLAGRSVAADPVDVLRLNVGGAAYTDGQGSAWDADDGTVCGVTQVLKTSLPIAGTSDDLLYQDARYAATLTCSKTLATHLYEIDLKFAEIFHTQTAKRVFDVYIENSLVAHNLDILAAAGGPNIAYDAAFFVNVEDGTLNIRLVANKDTALLNALRVTRIDAIPTATATNTPTSSVTPTPSLTATVTRTGTATRTPTITRTPTVTPTPTFVGEQRTVFQRAALPDPSYLGADDVTIDENHPTQTHGGQSNLYLRPILNYPGVEEEALMRFELEPYIPNDAVVGRAILSTFVYSATNPGVADMQVFALNRGWIPSSATWVEAYAGVPWDQRGAYAPTDREQTPSAVKRLPSCPSPWPCDQWVDIDITNLVQEWVSSPTDNNGMLLRLTNQTTSVEYQIRSSHYFVTTTVRPKLFVVWALPPITATPTATATPVETATPTNTATVPPTATSTPTATGIPGTPTRTATSTSTAAASPSATPTTCYDIYEPDDAVTQARPIGIGEMQQHSHATPNDKDWVKFPATTGYVYTIRTLGLLGPNNDTVLDLFDSNGMSLLAHNDDDPQAGGPGSRIQWQFAWNGMYYVRVTQLRGSEVWGCPIVYNVQVDREVAAPTPSPTPTSPASNRIYLPVIVALR